MLKQMSLFAWLFSMGLQLEILICQRVFDQPLVGPAEDFLLFFGVVPIQALLIVLWFVTEDRAIHDEVSEQICKERIAEVGHVSEFEEVRGRSLREIASSLRERITLSLRAYASIAWPFTVAGLMLVGLTLLVAVS